MPNKTSIIFWLIFILLIACLCSVMIGPTGFSWAILFDKTDVSYSILQYRLVRLLLALVAGSSMAASGASLQAIFRNSLADPHLFGVSGGAALGASIVIAFFANSTFAPSFGAILGGLLAFLIIFFYLQRSAGNPLSHCLLVGVLINSLAASLITILKTTLPASKTQSLLFWLVGHLGAVELKNLFLLIPLWLIGMAILWFIRAELELLSFGVEESQILGVDSTRIIKLAIIANCILIGNVVSFAGMIGFLGLVIPHFIRLTLFADLRFLLPSAAIFGGILLIIFDGFSRLSFSLIQSEIPVGAISALFLSPLFFFLLLRSRQYD